MLKNKKWHLVRSKFAEITYHPVAISEEQDRIIIAITEYKGGIHIILPKQKKKKVLLGSYSFDENQTDNTQHLVTVKISKDETEIRAIPQDFASSEEWLIKAQ
jgi:3,4-dihydroxy-2-butanone 4-phosphate synthase